MLRIWTVVGVGLGLAVGALAQDSDGTPSSRRASSSAAPESPVERNWKNFLGETFTPLTLAAGAFDGAFSQVTNSDPKYGVGTAALGQRIGASSADIATQNFFGDFVMASAFHENVIFMRKGPGHGGIWKRAGYAISRAFIADSDYGGTTFNWSNLTGTAMSTAFSNLYYPPASRTPGDMAIQFGTRLAGAGLANLYPEFWPDFKAMLQRHHLFPQRW